VDTSLSFLVFYGAYKLIKLVFDNTADRKVKYVSNGSVITQPLIVKYYNTLGLEYDQPINPAIIRKVFHKQLELSTDDRMRGYKPTYSLEELKAAKSYLIDFCDYTGRWN